MFFRVLVLFILLPFVSYSQKVPIQNTYLKKNKSNTTNNKTDISLSFITGTIALTGILLVTDDETYESAVAFRNQSPILRKLSPAITQLGDGKFSLSLFSALGVYHFISGDKKSGDAAFLGLESFLLSGISVQILKHTFGRERPSNSTLDGGKWNGPYIYFKGESIANFDAFPSGHTSTIFAAASSLSYIYPNGIIPYVSYGIASLVAISRVTESTHWLSDCLIGGLLGYFSTRFIIHFNDTKPKFNLGLVCNSHGYNFQFSYSLD